MKYDNTQRYTVTACDRLSMAAEISNVEMRRDRLSMAHAAATDALIEAATVAAITVDRREMAADIRCIVGLVVEAMTHSESTAVRRCIRAAGGPGAVNASVVRLLTKLADVGCDGTLPEAAAEPLPTFATDRPCGLDGLDYVEGAP